MNATSPARMNRYGRQAMQHWATHLPSRYARIPDPETFFATLGTDVADEISVLSADLAAQESAEPSYLTEIGRLNRVRSQAEELVLHERVFLPPETEPPHTTSEQL